MFSISAYEYGLYLPAAQVHGENVYLQYSNRQRIVNNKATEDVAGNVLLFGLGIDGKKLEPESNILVASIENMQYAATLDLLNMELRNCQSKIIEICSAIVPLHHLFNTNVVLSCKFVVWSACLLVDSVMTMSLGILLNDLGEIFENDHAGHLDANSELTTFWAPFFLLHLGGPDNITAYSHSC
ncbi:hypothetical protein Dsin_013257 [Dipteronia sinensis]|uniref:DUF4220 domain-containing protein n=1 Tax=Dipteronia sinensis TaxID=43782 RepID=A0AAE0AJQ9_9ROSI|nr:hypothetical protein Dsin_013257 [Dipteronia sinensis]